MSNINELFVPCAESLELKELEFNEPCFAFWDAYNGDTHLFFKPRKKYHWLIRLFNSLPDITTYSQGLLEYEEGDNAVLAPTFSQSFKFFRDKYPELDFGIDKIYNGSNKYHFHINYEWQFFEGTYEQAELECLRKLIETVKVNKL